MPDVTVVTLVSVSVKPGEVIPRNTRLTLDAESAAVLIARGQAIDPGAPAPDVTVAKPGQDLHASVADTSETKA